MIAIIRAQAQERKEKLWFDILERKDVFQKALADKGHLLYLSQRTKHSDVSIFIHAIDPNSIGDFIANELTVIPDITGLWIISLFKPIFYQLPKDTRDMKRYVITMKLFPSQLKNIYETLAASDFPAGVQKSYLAYTFHLFGDCLLLSVLAEHESQVMKDASEMLMKIPGVLSVHVNPIEKTHPLVSYEDWKTYATKYGIVQKWNHENMLQQFHK
ncbi:MAG: hypothetical protein HZA48_02330 [Planctomycetes bacterium]|nr:hypothetical protein [Planctomycetota bacterium]